MTSTERATATRAGPGDGVQLPDQGAGAHAAGGRFCSWAVVRGGDLFQRAGDEPVGFLDLCGEMVDGGEQHSQQPGVVVLELPGRSLDEGRPSSDHAAFGEFGQPDGPGPVATAQPAAFACTWLGRKPRPPTICGPKVPAVSRGTCTSTGPTSLSTVFARVPLRLLPLFFPAGSCFW